MIGRYSECPNCGSSRICYDSKKDISFCLSCGFHNLATVLDDRKKMNTEKKINILGTEYTITVKKYDENPVFKQLQNSPGYLFPAEKTITVCDMATYPGWNGKNSESCICQTKTIMRHQIVHAFLVESGLPADGNENEKLIHWFAIQGPKIFKAWQEAGAV